MKEDIDQIINLLGRSILHVDESMEIDNDDRSSSTDSSLDFRVDQCNDFSSSSPLPKRRRFKSEPVEIVPYLSKSKLKENLSPVEHEIRKFEDKGYFSAKKLDHCCVLSQFLEVPDTPMWVGFNCRISTDHSLKQKISYLNPLNESPTKVIVVAETMNLTQRIAKECN